MPLKNFAKRVFNAIFSKKILSRFFQRTPVRKEKNYGATFWWYYFDYNKNKQFLGFNEIFKSILIYPWLFDKSHQLPEFSHNKTVIIRFYPYNPFFFMEIKRL